ncbi:MAG: tetratricopeptide repeat protein, partial [Myxococcales bacterium]
MFLPLFAELKRRRVFRALVGYGIAAFAVLQIIEPVMHGLHWPDAVLSYVVVVLAIGFPIVVSLAWIFDVGASGVERAAPAPFPALRGPRLAVVLVGLGALAAAPGLVWYFHARGIQKPPSSASGEGNASIAVLPFVNLSSDKEQEYFSDGIAEEILNGLAQVEGLRVIGRTSSFSLKGKNEDLRSIGEKLNAAHLLEGSVRKSGARVRITAQLVEAAGGSHLWSQEFDREVTDVFAVQDEIARAVVAALRPRLFPAQLGAREKQRTANTEAHDQYLLGRHFLARGSPEGYGLAVRSLERTVALDSEYAPAWAALASALFWAADQDPARNDPSQVWPKAQAAAERAIALAPDLAEGYTARGLVRTNVLKDWSGARTDLERALSISPDRADILGQYAWLLGALGRVPEAIAALRKGTALDPLAANSWTVLSSLYIGTGRLDLAEAAARRALDVAPEHARAARNLGFALLLAGRHEEARAAFLRSSSVFFRMMGEALVEHELGHRAEAQRIVDRMLAAPIALQGSYQIAQV